MHVHTEQPACALLLCCTDLCACFFLNDLAANISPRSLPLSPRTHTGLGKRGMLRFMSSPFWAA